MKNNSENVNYQNIIRYNPDVTTGLSEEEVNERLENNLTNNFVSIPTKTIPMIIRDNTLTLFNIINFILALAVLYVKSYKNLLFMGVVLSNLVIGVVQEIRAKKAVDRLSIISSKKASVLRNGLEQNIDTNEIVLDDIICLSQGSQISADSIVLDGCCEVNESLITGESDSILKNPGDELFSGSFIVSGNCKAKVEHIGKENYASKISLEAKYIKKLNSEIMYTVRKIIKIISIIIIPLGCLLFYNQFHVGNNNLQVAVVSTVAALIGMIPEGLVLLTSTVLAVSVVRLSKSNVLVQELYCIETLARVDTLCLDKTGTITEGTMEVSDVIKIGSHNVDIQEVLSSLTSALNDNNSTFKAIQKAYNDNTNFEAKIIVPFSSENKWSGASFKDKGTYIIGAAEFILKDNLDEINDMLNNYNNDNRVILLAHSEYEFDENNNLPQNLKPLALILIKDTIKENAKEILEFFNNQDVDIKVISGDNTATVVNIAKRVGIKDYDNYIDATKLKSSEDIKKAIKTYSIFGRVTPQQKKEIIIALKEAGHTVAMTGDGVNDVLALKEADCSIAMASGNEAAINISQLVLLDSNFEAMPKVLAEGRRSINNIQRSSSLFLVKTIYSTLLVIAFLFLNFQYPFMPIQSTLINMFTIGIPSFVLALEPNNKSIKGNFFINIISKAIPAALTVFINIIFIVYISKVFELSHEQTSTLSVALTGYTGLLLLYDISKPFNLLRKILISLMTTSFALGMLLFSSIFSLAAITPYLIILMISLISTANVVYRFILKVIYKIKYIKQRINYKKSNNKS